MDQRQCVQYIKAGCIGMGLVSFILAFWSRFVLRVLSGFTCVHEFGSSTLGDIEVVFSSINEPLIGWISK